MEDFDGTLQRPTDAAPGSGSGVINAGNSQPDDSANEEAGRKGGISEEQVLGREPLDAEAVNAEAPDRPSMSPDLEDVD